jgi:hypothetical protein
MSLLCIYLYLAGWCCAVAAVHDCDEVPKWKRFAILAVWPVLVPFGIVKGLLK